MDACHKTSRLNRFRWFIGLFAAGCLLFHLTTGVTPVAASGHPDVTERLAGLARVWGAIKFFHPYVIYKEIDWDAALINAIPKVRAAESSAAYKAAVDEMLNELEDDMTEVVFRHEMPGRSRSVFGPEDTQDQPYIEWVHVQPTAMSAPDSIAVVIMTDYSQFTRNQKDPKYVPNSELEVRFENILDEIMKRSGKVIFDIRRKDNDGVLEDDGLWKDFTRRFMRRFRIFLKVNLPTAYTHSRLYTGYPSQTNLASRYPRSVWAAPPYFSAWLSRSGLEVRAFAPSNTGISLWDANDMPGRGESIFERFLKGEKDPDKTAEGFIPKSISMSAALPSDKTTKERPELEDMVFLINEDSRGLVYFLSAVKAGGAKVIQEGVGGIHVDVSSYRMHFSDSLSLITRLSEYEDPDGRIGFTPESVDHEEFGWTDDPGLAQAVNTLLENYEPADDERLIFNHNAVEQTDEPYKSRIAPSPEYRLLALFRFWNVIAYFYPFKDRPGRLWDQVLTDYIPVFDVEGDGDDYLYQVGRLATELEDSHTWVSVPGRGAAPYMDNITGQFEMPLRIRLMRDNRVVTDRNGPVEAVITNIDERYTNQLQIGDVLTTVNGDSISYLIDAMGKVIPASTDQAFLDLAEIYLTYSMSPMAVLSIRRTPVPIIVNAGSDKPAPIPVTTPGLPDAGYGYISYGEITDEDRVGYISLTPSSDSAFEVSPESVGRAMDDLMDARGIIFDLRGYQLSVGPEIASRLIREPITAVRFDIPQVLNPDPTENAVFSLSQTVYPSPPDQHYAGKVAVLINTNAMSASETICLFLAATDRVTFIGSPTVGANGNVTNMVLPGGVFVSFSGMAALYGDGRAMQRVGIHPTEGYYITPSLQGIIEGKDEVLIRAMEFIIRN